MNGGFEGVSRRKERNERIVKAGKLEIFPKTESKERAANLLLVTPRGLTPASPRTTTKPMQKGVMRSGSECAMPRNTLMDVSKDKQQVHEQKISANNKPYLGQKNLKNAKSIKNAEECRKFKLRKQLSFDNQGIFKKGEGVLGKEKSGKEGREITGQLSNREYYANNNNNNNRSKKEECLLLSSSSYVEDVTPKLKTINVKMTELIKTYGISGAGKEGQLSARSPTTTGLAQPKKSRQSTNLNKSKTIPSNLIVLADIKHPISHVPVVDIPDIPAQGEGDTQTPPTKEQLFRIIHTRFIKLVEEYKRKEHVLLQKNNQLETKIAQILIPNLPHS